MDVTAVLRSKPGRQHTIQRNRGEAMKTKTLNAFRPSGYTLVNGAAVPKAIIETLVSTARAR
jgi:hypothetical protein